MRILQHFNTTLSHNSQHTGGTGLARTGNTGMNTRNLAQLTAWRPMSSKIRDLVPTRVLHSKRELAVNNATCVRVRLCRGLAESLHKAGGREQAERWWARLCRPAHEQCLPQHAGAHSTLPLRLCFPATTPIEGARGAGDGNGGRSACRHRVGGPAAGGAATLARDDFVCSEPLQKQGQEMRRRRAAVRWESHEEQGGAELLRRQQRASHPSATAQEQVFGACSGGWSLLAALEWWIWTRVRLEGTAGT